MNRVILIGNLTRDPEVVTLGDGTVKCAFTVAVQRRYASTGGERIADFISVVAWRQLGELCAKYLAKGRKVGVEGSIQTRSYDAQDGSRRYVTEVIAESVEFLAPRDGGAAEPRGAKRDEGRFAEVDDDGLPF